MNTRLAGVFVVLVLIPALAPAADPTDKDRAIQKTASDFQNSVKDAGRQSGTGPFLAQPAFSRFAAGTSLSVPDGGTALLGSLNGASSASNRFGPPLASKVPGASRPFTNGSLGSKSSTNQSSVRVRIIILSEEEERQTGYSSRERR